jgi:hypothetical protein
MRVSFEVPGGGCSIAAVALYAAKGAVAAL